MTAHTNCCEWSGSAGLTGLHCSPTHTVLLRNAALTPMEGHEPEDRLFWHKKPCYYHPDHPRIMTGQTPLTFFLNMLKKKIHELNTQLKPRVIHQCGATMDGTGWSSTSQRCSTGLRSGELGGQGKTLQSSLCTSVHSWLVCAVWQEHLQYTQHHTPSTGSNQVTVIYIALIYILL